MFQRAILPSVPMPCGRVVIAMRINFILAKVGKYAKLCAVGYESSTKALTFSLSISSQAGKHGGNSVVS